MPINEISVFVDARCFQDPNFSYRGVGCHASSILKHRPDKTLDGSPLNFIGLVDPQMMPLDSSFEKLFDSTSKFVSVKNINEKCVLLNLSPMTASCLFLQQFLDNKHITKAALVYDFIPFDFPGYANTADFVKKYSQQLEALKQYDFFIPISEYTGNRLVEIFEIDKDKTYVSRVAVRQSIRQPSKNFSSEEAELLSSLPVASGEFFMGLAGEDLRKNINCAVDAVLRLGEKLNCNFPMLIAGHYSNQGQAEIRRLASTKNLDVSLIHFLPKISDELLAHLYGLAKAVIVPSFIEGFSMPVAEAVVAGGVAVVSDIDAHRELVASKEMQFDPNQPNQLMQKLEKLVLDDEFAKTMRNNQQAGLPDLREEKVGNGVWMYLLDKIKKAPIPKQLPVKNEKKRPLIAFFTPYPDMKNGVGLYTAATIRQITNHVDVDIFTQAEIPLGEQKILNGSYNFEENFDISRYDEVFFVIGNSQDHHRIIELYMEIGGHVIVHDGRLFEFYRWLMGDDGIINYASKMLQRKVDVDDIYEWLRDPRGLPSLFLDDIMLRANKVIVHSPLLSKEIKQRYGKDCYLLPHALLTSFKDKDLSLKRRKQIKRELGLSGHRVILGSFGVANDHKGCYETLLALRDLIDWGIEADLWFIGGIDDYYQSEMVKLAKDCSLEKKLFFTGYISEKKYRKFLLGTDIGLQFRKAPDGQISGALAECIAAGLPSIANRALVKAIDCPSYVKEIPDRLSPLLIAESIAEVLKHTQWQLRYSEERDMYIKEHSMENYADIFMQEILGLKV